MADNLRKRFIVAGVSATLSVVLASCSTSETHDTTTTPPEVLQQPEVAQPAEPEISSELALSTFDAAWTMVHETDFDTTHGGVDWNAARDEFRPRAAEATTQNQLRRVIQEMLMRLQRSHFALIPGDLVDRKFSSNDDDSDDNDNGNGDEGDSEDSDDLADGDRDVADDDARADAKESGEATFGMTLRLVEEKATVVAVAPNSPAARAGVQPGWAILTFEGHNPTEGLDRVIEASGSMGRYAASAYLSAMDTGPRTRHALVFLDANDSERALTLRRRPSPARMVSVGSLPPMPLQFESGWVDDETLARAGATGARIGFIRFTVWLPEVAARFNAAVDELRGADGIIIDLRGNPGGFGGMVMGMGGHFVKTPVSIGTMVTRDNSLEFRLNPRRSTLDGKSVEPIAAPLAILVDPLSASTSEMFAGGMQDIGRARIFGQTTAGAVLPAQLNRLPNGDVLLHAFADFRLPSGEQLEGVGVVPNEPRELLRADLSRDGDPVTLDAVRWIRASTPRVP